MMATRKVGERELMETNLKVKKELLEESQINKILDTSCFWSVFNILPGLIWTIIITTDIAELTYG